MDSSTNDTNIILEEELKNLKEEYEREKKKYNAYGYDKEKFKELEKKYEKDKNSLIKEHQKATKPAQSRMIVLSDILENLASKGNFAKCVILDTKGMIISDYGETEINKITIGAMFALVHNVINRTIDNLKLDGLEVLKLNSTSKIIYSKIFNVEDYERDFILTTFEDKMDKNATKKKKKKFRKRHVKEIKKIILLNEAVKQIQRSL